ncbi:MAG TPA: MFS transporter [Candidatus Acidoferrum sp.]|nr:MFS transporter [Candidatus Acidoferrum sp.]
MPRGAVLSGYAAWAPFTYKAFAVIWIATVVSNIGGWMYSAAAGWLMTDLTTDPLLVSLVQVANTLPLFMFALPAGALTDIVDRRKLLIAGEAANTIVPGIFAVMVWTNHVSATSLLVFMFLIGVFGTLTSPAWQAVTPELVPKSSLSAAISWNSVGVNVSRAIGPALAGAIIGPLGIAAPFVVDAVSNLGVNAAIVWWREPKKPTSGLPVERFGGALRLGFRYARNNPALGSTLGRCVAFFLFASSYWALLPLVARNQIHAGPQIYGILLGAIGLGAVGGSFALPKLKERIGPDRLVGVASIGTAIALVLFGVAREPLVALVACIMAGVSWIVAIATLNVSAQVALPDWVRGRGLAIYITVMFGAMTLGSALWGEFAAVAGLPLAHFASAAALLLAIPLSWRWKLQRGAQFDLTPSMSWPPPIVSDDVEVDASDGPVLVTVEYRLAGEESREPFLANLTWLRRERLRDGAFAWGIFEDTAKRGRFLETFEVDSWAEHLRQHERVTHADEAVQQNIRTLLAADSIVTHYISPS